MTTEHTLSKRFYYGIFALLIVCTVLTWWIAYYDLGPLNTVAALGIAAFKASIVALFFMHAKYSTRLTWAVILGSIFWLGIMLALTMGDYVTRVWQTF
jgi:cytochrome c oxidase subunit 4